MLELKSKSSYVSILKINTLFLMTKLLPFVLGCSLFLSCSIVSTDARKDRLFKRDENLLIEKINLLVKADQENRTLSKLYKSKNNNNTLDMDSITYEYWEDSIRTIQQKIDYSNSIELIKITKKYGFPDNSRLSKKNLSWIIFQHTPERLKKRVRRILIKENEKGRFKNEATLKFIMWHLEGRKMDFFNNIKTN